MVSILVQIETGVLSIQEGGNNSLLLLFFFTLYCMNLPPFQFCLLAEIRKMNKSCSVMFLGLHVQQGEEPRTIFRLPN